MDEPPEIDRIVSELNELREQDGSEPASAVQLDAWLKTLMARGGSDLLLVAGAPACIRAKGVVQKIDARPLDGPEIEAAVLPQNNERPPSLLATREYAVPDFDPA